jgi:ribA/ribD-fused uncharacterized protein
MRGAALHVRQSALLRRRQRLHTYPLHLGPKEQKKSGKKVVNFSEEAWTGVKSRVAEVGNWYKFTQDEKLRGILLETAERELAEASSVDRVWGIGFKAKDAEGNRGEWGENRLGRALMRVTERIEEAERKEKEGSVVRWD